MSISQKKYRSNYCLNCEHPLDRSDKYCSNCGQINSNKRLSLSDFINEFLANFYAYDSRIRRTIISFVLKPGQAAKEFVNGKRQSYVNPFRFYLSISIIYFILIGLEAKYESIYKTNSPRINFNNHDDKIIEANLDLEIPEKDTLKTTVKLFSEKEIENKYSYNALKLKLETFSSFYEQNPSLSIEEALDSLGYMKSNSNKFIYKKVTDITNILEKNGEDQSFTNYILSNLPIIIFVSLPFLTLAFSFVYIRKKMYYAEHMVFVFSTMSFVFFILIINEMLRLIFNLNIDGLIFSGLFFYFYKSLRNFYQQSRWKTIFKFVILNFILMFLTSIAVLIGLGLVFLTY